MKYNEKKIGKFNLLTAVEPEVDENGNTFYRLLAMTKGKKFVWKHPTFSA